MGAPELMALSLGLSVVVAALGWAGGLLVERLTGDPRLRDRVWATALILPALPTLAIGLLLLTPAPVRDIALPTADLPSGLAMGPAELATTASPAGTAFDPGLAAWVVLGLAVLLAATRLAVLALRAGRLLRIIARAQTPGPAVVAMVEDAARDLAIRPPLVRISAAAPEALLASLGRARLILPAGLIDPSVDPAATRAVIAHELSHLKRGDHRALWLEEALLALLAVNPLMPTLRARRAAAREEACDALALSGATPHARRAYARSLIEALRDRAGPQTSGGLPALTFTGAGRTTVMKRLRAVISPARPARPATRLAALGFGIGLAVVVGSASVALAGQRAEVLRPTAAAQSAGSDFETRLMNASAADYQLFCAAAEGTMDRMACYMLLWDAADAEQSAATPGFCAPGQGDAALEIIAERGRAAMLTGPAGRGSARDGARRAMIAAFPCGREPRPIPAVAVARASDSLGAEWEQRHGASARREAAARRAAAAATTGADYQRFCASRDPGEEGFCAGVLFRVEMAEARSASPAFCAPDYVDQAATGRFVSAARAGVAQVRVSAGQSPEDVARAGLVRAYPCAADERTASNTSFR